MTACTATLDTVELLKNILLYLPIRTLLLFQRGSRKARQALFLDLSGDVKIDYDDDVKQGLALIRPDEPTWQGGLILNPFWHEFTSTVCERHFSSHDIFYEDEEPDGWLNTVHKPWNQEGLKPFGRCIVADQPTGASWKSMAVFYPPMHLVSPTCEKHEWSALVYDGVTNKGKLGVTFGDMAVALSKSKAVCDDCLEKALDACIGCSRRSRHLQRDYPGTFFDAARYLRSFSTEITGWQMLEEITHAEQTGLAMD
ncbi:hypothetical protein LTR56_004906 [Elasticomyces elasticus]|nr:hypothetical protein LTR56_004906 [Elasticomyces elasticus]KAK3664680.1 hypothetical protein LTR22_004548 [Elasticomyces elasticus]KAK4913731.1 hypothetical protein LTR49_017988 [Elasticomyces elasticus]KAK5747730.1 hypothetical protein LTS12_022227 [Elasticomyces elasticus]